MNHFISLVFLFSLSQIVVVIDTSSSLEGRFNLIKRKLRQLLREQILHKTAFNLIQFSTDVIKWRDHLVPTTPQNISAAREWIDGMGVSGSTNTLEALQEALSISGAEAVYFLTDGRYYTCTCTYLSNGVYCLCIND